MLILDNCHKNYKFKYEMVVETIKEEINDGVYPAGKLPSEKEFMRQFNVGKITIYNALKKLAEAGIITRTKKKGTYVNKDVPKAANRLIGVLIRPKGHIYSNLSQGTKEKLLGNRCFPVFIDFSAQSEDEHLSKQRRILNDFLNSSNDGIIFDGESYYQNPFLRRYPKVPSVVVNYFDSADEFPGSAVLADFEQGTNLATSHLIANGHRNILLLNNLPVLELIKKTDDIHQRRHPVIQLTNGYSRAMKDHHLDKYQQVVYRNSGESSYLENLAHEVLSAKNRPTAIICDYDHLALQVIEVATKMGIKVPNDLAVIGTHNTPWCEMSSIKITSISFNEEEMGRRAAELILADNTIRETIKVKPELVIRESA